MIRRVGTEGVFVLQGNLAWWGLALSLGVPMGQGFQIILQVGPWLATYHSKDPLGFLRSHRPEG